MPLKSWLNIPRGSHFSLANIPFGIISHGTPRSSPRPAVAIGDHALDLELFTAHGGFHDLGVFQQHSSVFSQPTLNAFAALGRPIHSLVRRYLQSVLAADTPFPAILKDNQRAQAECLIPRRDVQMHLPMDIRDYTDFYAGLNHAFNCGSLFRGPQNALQPNYKHLPVGYHGRASSVVISGTDIKRPNGQVLDAATQAPVYSACKKLDMELELGAFVASPNEMGTPVSVDEAEDRIFGFVLLNDWSARDVQAWEYVPLGPFNSKNFGTSISPWVVLAEALEPFKTAALPNDTPLQTYLQQADKRNVYDISLEVDLTTPSGQTATITRTSSKNLLFSFPQMIAHHTVTGCPMNTGDLLGSGTISGTEPTACGSLLEQNQNGKVKIQISEGIQRTFLEDGDRVTFRGVCGSDPGELVGFGECTGSVLPANKIA